MTTVSRLAACIVPIFFMSASVPANAQAADEVEQNAQERINYSGKLRMLSQRIPSAACHFARGIEPEGAMALLTDATAEFSQILTALEFGDPTLNILEAETRRKTLAQLVVLREKWGTFETAAIAVAEGRGTDQDLGYLFTQSPVVLREAQFLVEELVKQYANPNAATRASLMLIDISGRQRMLSQRISKQACMIGGEHETENTLTELAANVRIFEASLEALRFGMPQVGVLPPPNDEISQGLGGVLDDWNKVRPLIGTILEGGSIDDQEHVAKFRGLNVTMGDMNTVVGMYTQAAGAG